MFMLEKPRWWRLVVWQRDVGPGTGMGSRRVGGTYLGLAR